MNFMVGFVCVSTQVCIEFAMCAHCFPPENCQAEIDSSLGRLYVFVPETMIRPLNVKHGLVNPLAIYFARVPF